MSATAVGGLEAGVLTTTGYRLRLARCAEDVAAAQRLRYEVFNLELKEGLAASEAEERDADEFDAVCDHLLVEVQTGLDAGRVVGTYRLQTGAMAARSGLGYYSAREFDFAPLEPARTELIELGRACVAAEHRNQSVLSLLWRGVGRYATTHGARYLTGCSSLPTREAEEGRAAWIYLRARYQVEPRWRTAPLVALSCGDECVTDVVRAGAVKIPRLMGGYLALGAKLCGAPALDREFGTIDFLTWLDLAIPSPGLRKFLG
jgi:putative hemolysin